MSAWIRRFWPLLLLLFLQGLFMAWPLGDLQVSAAFYSAPDGFVLADSWLAGLVGVVFGNLHIVLLLILPWLMLASAYWGGAAETQMRTRLYFLFLVVALAPGLAVGILEAESGRAHPVDVQSFAGEQRFTAAFQPARECVDHCSFVSREAASGFVLLAFAWVLGDRRWIWIGVAAGAAVGAVQIAAGEHFLSDVIFAFWIVYGVSLGAARLLLGDTRVQPATG